MNTRTWFYLLTALALAAIGGAVAFIASGTYGIGADDPHTTPVRELLAAVRENAVRAHARELVEPVDLADANRIRLGAGNYAHMCAGCHRVPGGGETELSRGLYPAPPDLTRWAVDPREGFWVIKHGIKGSGMPAWGSSMDDASIWNLVAFMRVLPRLDRAGYDAMVAASGGHSHGVGVSGQGADAPAEHADAANARPATTHVHSDGRVHDHAQAAPPAIPPESSDAAAHDERHEHSQP